MTPSFGWHGKSLQLSLAPRATLGMWSGSGLDGDISLYGTAARASWFDRNTTLTMSGEIYHAANGLLDGSYSGIGADATTQAGSLLLGGGVKYWTTPLDNEFGYSAFVAKNVTHNIRVDVSLAQSLTDPILATPASFGASVGVSWRIARPSPPAARRVAALGVNTANGRLVHFTIERPQATKVELSGSFTSWMPVSLKRTGKTFSIELSVPPGTHQYGFLIDGKDWYLPPEATGVIDDGFGRKNATLIIEKK